MKPTLFRLITLVLSFVLGVEVWVYSSTQKTWVQVMAPVDNGRPNESVNYPPVKTVVISVPADGEFYIGKHRLDLKQISDAIAVSLASVPNNERVVYLKSVTGVKVETLALVINEVKRTGVDRIEFVLDKKKIDRVKHTR